MTDTKKRMYLYPLFLLLAGGLAYGGFLYEPDADVQTLVASAEVLAQVGMFDKAIDRAERALSQEPDNRYAHIILAYCYGQKDQLDRSLGSYETAIELTESSPDGSLGLLRLYRAEILCRAERAGEALEEAEDVLEKDPEQQQARFVIARALRAEDRASEAIRQYRALAEASPSDPVPLVLWAETERERENDEGAVEILDRVVALAPDNPEYRMRKACVHEALGDREAAVTEVLVAAEVKAGVVRRWFDAEPELAGLGDEPRISAAIEARSGTAEEK